MTHGIQNVLAPQQRQQPGQQTFTPQISTSRIADALLRGAGRNQVLETPLEAVGNVAQQLSGAFLARKAEQRQQEQQQARVSSLGDVARILAGGPSPVLPAGVQGPQIATQQQQIAGVIGGVNDPALASQLLGIQQSLDQQQPLSNVQFDAAGNAIGIRGDQVVNIPGGGGIPAAGPGVFGARERAVDARKLQRKRVESDREFTSKLRGENRTVSKSFLKQEDAIGRIRAVTRDKDGNLIQTPAASLALIFNFMKMLDPESVVRESEFRTAEQARGWFSALSEEQQQRVPTAFVQTIQKATGEGRMTPEQILDFTQRAEDILAQSTATNADQISTIAASAKAQGVSFDRIFSKGQRAALEQNRLQNLTDEELEEEIRRGAQ